MLKKSLFILFIALSSLSFGQKSSSNAFFMTFYAGDLAILSENFTNYYDSKNELIFGAGIGIPLNSSFSFDISASYYSKKSEYPAVEMANSFNNAVLKQLILNSGFQAHLLPNRIVGLSFLLGVNYSFIDEERKDPDGEFTYQIEGKGNFGVYGGANFEISFGRSPFALFGDVKYTYSWEPLLEFSDTYRELRYTGGIKLYLSKRWK